MIKKNILNIIIDTVSLVIFMFMISTGLVLKFVLPPGSGRIVTLLQGGGRREKVISLFMGLTRHEWGQIHLCIALIFLVLLIIHLFLHWRWIKDTAFGAKDDPRPLKRRVIAIGIIFFIILALIFPWIGSKEALTKSEFLKTRELQTPR